MANFQIRPFRDDDIDDIVELSLLAWEPVFQSFEQVLGTAIYRHIYPDWQTSQRNVVTEFCQNQEKNTTWVADVEGRVVGFVTYELNVQDKTGEVMLLAVHPDHQDQGIGTDLNHFALSKLKEAGMKLAVVGTGGDPGHAPARRSYEKAGYTALPIVRYYKDLAESSGAM